MSCECSSLEQLVAIEDCPKEFINGLIEIEQGGWVKLMKCPVCGQLWRVDVWDKYQTQFAVKIDTKVDWENIDISSLQKKYLLQRRGGTTKEECIWANCSNPQVKGVVYCIEHLYETGARK